MFTQIVGWTAGIGLGGTLTVIVGAFQWARTEDRRGARAQAIHRDQLRLAAAGRSYVPATDGLGDH